MSKPRTRLAIDPGTKCGWAICVDGVYTAETWNLAGRKSDGAGMRYMRLRKSLERILGEFEIFELAYEEVRGHKGTDAAHVYGGIVAIITTWCEEKKIPYLGVPVGTVKKFATGYGNANKDAMVEAARREFEHVSIDDDNQADALWILRYLETQ
jgi:Holliday junction resolvasome RuvABC endonuclease subunit